MFMATITTNKLLLLLCLFALLPLAMEMMPLQAQSAGTICGAVIALVYMVCENYFLQFYCKMAVFKKGQKVRQMMQFGFIIKLVCCLGWLCGLAFGQAGLSDALTGSVTFPALGITCIGNLAVFYRCILRGPPKMDIGAKDVITTVTAQKLKKINELQRLSTYEGEGLTTCPHRVNECDVVMFSKQMPPNSSMQQFMEYMSNVHHVNSIFLQYLPLPSAQITVELCTCKNDSLITCGCIVFDTSDLITVILVRQIPGILKRLSGSQFLLPCWTCRIRGCHGCKQGLLHSERDGGSSPNAEDILIEDRRYVDVNMYSIAPVCGILDEIYRSHDCIICIPVQSARYDEWTKQLITLLELKGNEVGAGTEWKRSLSASSYLKNYIAGSREMLSINNILKEDYNIVSLIIVPTLTEVLINIALTFWFKADGFSSALVARRALDDYLPGHSGGGFSPIAFLRGVIVKSGQNDRDVCQVLRYRGSRLSLRPLYFMMGFVNLICSG